jgi:cytochrome c oxidase subunit 3
MSFTDNKLAEQYTSLDQQRETSILGIWIFLSTEVLFFGGIFLALFVYHLLYSNGFSLGVREMHFLLGTINTAVLLTSSLTMALAVKRAKEKYNPATFLLSTALLGCAFLFIKALEYHSEYKDSLIPGINLTDPYGRPKGFTIFLILYFVATALHALHLLIGIILVGGIGFASRIRSGIKISPLKVEVIGLYWHFIDIVWIFLYPLLYLVGRK